MGLQDVSFFYPDGEDYSLDPECPLSDGFSLWHLVAAASIPSVIALLLGCFILKRSNERFSEFVDSIVNFLGQVIALKECVMSVLRRWRGVDAASARPDVEIGRPVNLTDDEYERRLATEAREARRVAQSYV